MSKLEFQLTTDPSAALQGISQVDGAQRNLAVGAREYEKDSKKAFEEAAKGSKKLGDETEEVVTKIKSLKAQLRELKAELANATDPAEVQRLAQAAGLLADQIGDASDAAAVFATDSPFEAVGNAIGSVGQKLLALDFQGAADQSQLLVTATRRITFKDVIGSVKQLGTTLLNLGKSLLLNPLFLIPILVTAIVANFDKLTNAGGIVGKVFKAIGGFISSVIDAGKDFLDFIGLIDNTTKSLEELTKANEAMTANITARYDLEIAKAKRAKKEVEKLEIEKAKAVIKSVQTQLQYTKDAYASGELDLEEYVQKLQEIGLSSNKANIDLINAQAAAEKKAEDDRKKSLDQFKKNKEDFTNALLDLFKKAQAAELDSLSGLEKINKQKELSEKELQNLQELLLKKQALAGKGNVLSAEQQTQFNELQLAIDRKYGQDVLGLDIQLATERGNVRIKEIQNRKADIEAKQKLFDLETEIRIEEINALKKPIGISEADFENKKAVEILEIKKKAAQDSLNLKISQINAETGLLVQQAQNEAAILMAKGDAESVAQAQRLYDSTNQIQTTGDKQAQLLTLQTQNLTEQIDSQIDALNASLKQTKGIDWAALLGVSQEQFDLIKQGLTQLAGEIKSFYDMFSAEEESRLEKEQEITQNRINDREKNISDLESKLQDQQALQDAGYANDVQLIQDKLKEEEAAKNDEIKRGNELKAERKKLAKEQFLIDTALQASNLTTAISQIFATYAAVPYVAAALAAVMIGSFAYATGKASAAVNAIDGGKNSFKDGVIDLQGPGTETSDSIHAKLSKGESVMTAQETRDHLKLFKGIRKKDRRLMEIGVRDLLKDKGISLFSEIPADINAQKNALKQSELNLLVHNNNSGLERKFEELSTEFKKMTAILRNSHTVLPDGTIIIKNGDLTQRIKPHGK